MIWKLRVSWPPRRRRGHARNGRLQAAGGMTNREIAQALFVTLRTVEIHLTHTYQKLDITSREALPNALEP